MSSPRVRPTFTAWTTARLMPLTGTTTRWRRCGRRISASVATRSSASWERYCRFTHTITPTMAGITIGAIHAPLGTFAIVMMIQTTAVITPPTRLSTARHLQPRVRSFTQWITMPDWLIEKDRKIPIE